MTCKCTSERIITYEAGTSGLWVTECYDCNQAVVVQGKKASRKKFEQEQCQSS